MAWKYYIFFFFACIIFNKSQALFNNYHIKEFEVPVDHFNFANNKTFNIRYLYNDSFVKAHSDVIPILFYTGGEGYIELFAENTGFLFELAAEMKAYIIFAEHRYYGKSLPFGASSTNVTEHLGYLSVEQVLEDYISLITSLTNGKQQTMPVVAFGGSYGGMLAAWLRMKYPHLVVGALAASAPVLQFNGLTSCDIYSRIVTSVFTTSYSTNCSANIKDSWNFMKNLSANDEGRKRLNEIFNFCKPLKEANDIHKFFDYLEDVYGNLAMVNYPYKNEFLAPVPAFPVRQFCLYLKQKFTGLDLVIALQKALSVYSNFTGTVQCLETEAYGPTLEARVWDIQTCNQMVMPMCNKDSMFVPKDWNFENYSDNCYKKFGLRPKLNDITQRYGGRTLEYSSNIIFSNGLLDPWSGGGVLNSDTNQIEIIIIPEGAHHIDLRATNPDDPASVTEARKQEKEIIYKWIKQSQRNFL